MHIIIILNHVLIYQNSNFQGKNHFLFFVHFPGSLQVTEFINWHGKSSATLYS